MRANERALLSACIDTGIESGYLRAHKSYDNPYAFHIYEQIENAIWYEIDQYFVLDNERDLCDEIMEGFNTPISTPDHPDTSHVVFVKDGDEVRTIRFGEKEEEHMSDEPRDGEIRAVNYITRAVEDGQPTTKHRLEQYYSGEWREIRVYDEDEDGKLSAREIDRLRAKKKQIYEDLKDMVDDAVDREWTQLFEGSKDWRLCSPSERVEWLLSMYQSVKEDNERLEKMLASATEAPKREWVGLTDDEVEEVFSFPWHCMPFARAIEAKLKEKNNG